MKRRGNSPADPDVVTARVRDLLGITPRRMPTPDPALDDFPEDPIADWDAVRAALRAHPVR